MFKTIKWSVFFLAALAILMSACTATPATPDEQQAQNAIATAVEMTVIARSTEMAASLPQPSPIPPTVIVLPTNTPLPLPTLLATNTPFTLPPSGSGSSGSSGGSSGSSGSSSGSSTDDKYDCEVVYQKPWDGQFIYKPGDEFDVVWTVKNTGSKTWEATWMFSYFSDYGSGKRLSPTANFPIGQEVKPGKTLDLLIEIIAPNIQGLNKEQFTEQWTIIGDGVKFCRPYISIFVQK